MKQLLCVLCVFLFTVMPLFSGEESRAGGTARAARNDNGPVIERLAIIKGFTRQGGRAGAVDGPNLLLVDETTGEIGIPQGTREGGVIVRPAGDTPAGWEAAPAVFPRGDGGAAFKFGPWHIEASAVSLSIETEGRVITRLGSRDIEGGLAFVLENGDGKNYSCFFVNSAGEAGAADTRGRVYRKKEAVQLLRLLDGEKFSASMERAGELGLAGAFQNGEALVWGRNYYAPARILNRYWGRTAYPLGDAQIQYDSGGNGYQLCLDQSNDRSGAAIWIVDPDGNSRIIDLNNCSQILKTYGVEREFTIAFHVDSGQNIYFFVAGDEYTELFRIRRNLREDP
ncbi:MAG: hypothetical protein LBB83_01970 [Treponema sp.]|jgi:hypothetical protein|nr:hypothetical protein [Treponema sp.]